MVPLYRLLKQVEIFMATQLNYNLHVDSVSHMHGQGSQRRYVYIMTNCQALMFNVVAFTVSILQVFLSLANK